jgi:CheY-like chemotaxis protein
VIMLTIVDSDDLGFCLGAADILTKPIERDRLSAVLRKHCPPAGPSHILVVDDDRSTRRLLRRMLEPVGYSVEEADNGRSALEAMTANRPALVLLDLMMPEMDGFEFLREVAARSGWRDVPIVVVTARDLSQDERQQIEGRVETILRKGTHSRRELLDEVRALVAAAGVSAKP